MENCTIVYRAGQYDLLGGGEPEFVTYNINA